MKTLNLYEARANLSRLVDEAGNGESIVIAKDGRPLAALVPLAMVAKAPFEFGTLKGKISVVDDTPETDAEIEQLFTEGEIFPR
jgi:prevent-host-death family protein